MGIAETIERVRRQARQAGLNAVIEGFGEQLRSSAIPTPLRGAAWRIASLLEAACPPSTAGERARELIHRDRAEVELASRKQADPSERTPHVAGATESAQAEAETAREPLTASGESLPAVVAAAGAGGSSSEIVPNVSRAEIREVSPTATDTGEAPLVPNDDDLVQPEVVGATPTYNATPELSEVVDATPVDDGPIDALDDVVEVTPIPVDDDRSERAAPDADERSEPRDLAPAARSDDGRPREASSSPSDGSHSSSSESSEVRPIATKASSEGRAKPRSKSGSRTRSNRPPASTSSERKEEVAASSEAAKTLARSNSRGSKRRSRAKADTSKKK